MAQSRRNDIQRETPTDLERVPNDRQQIAVDNEGLFDGFGPVLESLDLGHAGLRSECWAALRQRTLRLPRSARQRTPLHLARPSAPAEARFTPLQGEFIE